MLVLSRRVGQQIRIGESVVVTLLQIDRHKARLGVEAPAEMPVFRQELLDFERGRSTPAPSDAPGRTVVASDEPKPRRSTGSPCRKAMTRSLWDSVSA